MPWKVLALSLCAALCLALLVSITRDRDADDHRATVGVAEDAGNTPTPAYENTLTTEDGARVAYTTGTDVQLPSTWPADVPILTEGTLTYVGRTEKVDGTTVAMVTFESRASTADVWGAYTTELVQYAWTIESITHAGVATILSATRDSRRVTVQITEKNETGLTKVSLTIEE